MDVICFRPLALVENFLAAYDVRLVLDMASTEISSNWHYAVYLLATISLVTFIITKQSRYK